jgi:hypothetical protein
MSNKPGSLGGLTPEIAYIHAIRDAGNRLMTAAEAHQVRPSDDTVRAELEAALDEFDDVSRSEIEQISTDLDDEAYYGTLEVERVESMTVTIEICEDGLRKFNCEAYSQYCERSSGWDDGLFGRVRVIFKCNPEDAASAQFAARRIGADIWNYRLCPSTRLDVYLVPEQISFWRGLWLRACGKTGHIPLDDWAHAFLEELERLRDASAT